MNDNEDDEALTCTDAIKAVVTENLKSAIHDQKINMSCKSFFQMAHWSENIRTRNDNEPSNSAQNIPEEIIGISVSTIRYTKNASCIRRLMGWYLIHLELVYGISM